MYIDKDDLITHFYKTFEIEPIPIKSYGNWLIKGSIAENDKGEKVVYPEITDRRLLNMICILNNYGKYDCWGITATRLKDAILENCIAVVVSKLLNDVILEQFKHQIQQLFKEKEK